MIDRLAMLAIGLPGFILRLRAPQIRRRLLLKFRQGLLPGIGITGMPQQRDGNLRVSAH